MTRLIQLLLRSERVRKWIIARAMKRPFKHLVGYMNRYWFFNERWRIPYLPAIRVHCILRRDYDRDIHDHPFDFRSFILFGSYIENDVMNVQRAYYEGDTYKSRAERFHLIVHVEPDDRFYPAAPIGVWTMVIMSRKRQPWGFLTNLKGYPTKVHHNEYESNNFIEPEPQIVAYPHTEVGVDEIGPYTRMDGQPKVREIPRCEPGKHKPIWDEEDDGWKCAACGLREYQAGWNIMDMAHASQEKPGG